MITQKEEDQLLAACRKGHRQAQRQLYDRYAGDMYVVCLRYAKNEDEAKDILQEAFIKIFKNISFFRGESKLYHWIKKVVINTALNQHRNKHHLIPVIEIKSNHSVTDDAYAVSDYHWKELLDMVGELPQGCRVILLVRTDCINMIVLIFKAICIISAIYLLIINNEKYLYSVRLYIYYFTGL